MRVLIADDDMTTRVLVGRIITSLGFEIMLAKDGDEAVSILKSDNRPQIAVLDRIMPGCSGIEVCRQYYTDPQAPFLYSIIMSGDISKEQIIEALHAGAHDVLEKPVDKSILASRLEVGTRLVKEKETLIALHAQTQEYALKMEKLAEERARQLVHSERVASLGVMSAGIAHEINNPMSFISGNVQSLKRFWTDIEPVLVGLMQPGTDCVQSDPAKLRFVLDEMPRIFQGIMTGVERVTTIVKALKRYAGNHRVERREFELSSAIDQALMLTNFTIGKQVRLFRTISCEPIPIVGDSTEIEQVLVNLLVNAWHAVEGNKDPEIAISSRLFNSHAEIVVEDNGCGIPDEVLARIWDPFFTTKPVGKGTGLGLSICAGIVRDHGGDLVAENREPSGARFKITLPVAAQNKDELTNAEAHI